MNAGRLALVLLALSLSSAAHAQKYVEIWNPPEAHGHTGTQPSATTAHAHRQSTRQALKQPVRQTIVPPRLAKKITEPAVAGASRAQQGAASVVASKRSASRTIPRKIGPDGNVFRV